MNPGMIFYILSWVGCFSGLFLLPSCIVALIYHEPQGFAYLGVAAFYILFGFLLTRRKPSSNRFTAQDGYVTVALTWGLISLLGSVPFWLSRDIPNLVDAIFETVSGFTTTGSTILQDIEALSHCSLFWRSFTHWLGGMGILVFVMAVLPLSSGKNIHLMRAESTGPSVEKLVPKVRQTAALLYLIYVALTAAEFILLLLGRMPLFEAITAAFATAGTGGFAVLNTSMASYSPYLQYVVTVFMLLFGVSFNVYFLILVRKFKSAFFYEELKISRRWGATLVTLLCAVIGVFCSLSFGDGREWLMIGDKSLFNWFDYLTGQIFLPTGGLLTCLFLGWYVSKHIVKDEFTNGGTLRGRFFGFYLFSVRFICPICILLIFLHQFGVI